MSDEEFENMVKQRLLGMMQDNGNRQRVINLNEVEHFITEGWEFVAALPKECLYMKRKRISDNWRYRKR